MLKLRKNKIRQSLAARLTFARIYTILRAFKSSKEVAYARRALAGKFKPL